MNKSNNPVISGTLILMRPHTCASETNKKWSYLVYMHDVQIEEDLFPEWKEKHLTYYKAEGSGGIAAGSDYDYIVFTLGEFRDDYDFLITDTRHGFKAERIAP